MGIRPMDPDLCNARSWDQQPLLHLPQKVQYHLLALRAQLLEQLWRCRVEAKACPVRAEQNVSVFGWSGHVFQNDEAVII